MLNITLRESDTRQDLLLDVGQLPSEVKVEVDDNL
jgi:hypothetical protein